MGRCDVDRSPQLIASPGRLGRRRSYAGWESFAVAVSCTAAVVGGTDAAAGAATRGAREGVATSMSSGHRRRSVSRARVRCVHCEVVAVLHGDRARCREAPTCGGEGLPHRRTRRFAPRITPRCRCCPWSDSRSLARPRDSVPRCRSAVVSRRPSCSRRFRVLPSRRRCGPRRTSSCRTRDPYRDQHWRCRTDSTDRGRSRFAHSPPSSPLPSATPPGLSDSGRSDDSLGRPTGGGCPCLVVKPFRRLGAGCGVRWACGRGFGF